MTVKKCDLSHLNQLDKFYGEVVDYLVATVNYPRWTPGVYPCKETVKSSILKGEQFALFENGEVLGSFVFNQDPAGDYSVGEWKVKLKESEFAIIHTLATHYKSYGKGVAKKMVNFCLQLAKERGYKAVRLDVVPDNYPAIELYKSLGFTFAGEKDLGRGFDHIPTFVLYEFNF